MYAILYKEETEVKQLAWHPVGLHNMALSCIG